MRSKAVRQRTSGLILLANRMRRAMKGLISGERAVMDCRFGLLDGRAKTLKAVGAEFDMAPGKIRAIEMKTLQLTRVLATEGAGR